MNFIKRWFRKKPRFERLINSPKFAHLAKAYISGNGLRKEMWACNSQGLLAIFHYHILELRPTWNQKGKITSVEVKSIIRLFSPDKGITQKTLFTR